MTSAERCYRMEREHENACAEQQYDRRYADLMERTAERHMELART